MKKVSCSVWVVVCLLVMLVNLKSVYALSITEGFDTNLDDSWSFTGHGGSGSYGIDTSSGYAKLNHANQLSNPYVSKLGNVPYLYTTVSGDFEASTYGFALNAWTADFKSFGILAEIDYNNYLYLSSEWSNTLGSRIVAYGKVNGKNVTPTANVAYGTSSTYFKMEKNGNIFSSYFSLDNQSWIHLGDLSLLINSDDTLKLGLAVVSARSRSYSRFRLL
ncbi:MAG: hypothetical protein V6Z89_20065 [Desulfobacter sp.]